MHIAEALAYAYCRSLSQCLLDKPKHMLTAKADYDEDQTSTLSLLMSSC